MKKLLKHKICFFAMICVVTICSLTVGMMVLSGDKFSGKQKNVYLQKTAAQKNSIPIAMAADDNYTYPTIVSITSLVENSSAETNYEIYIMVPGGFAEENKQKLLGLQEKYENRCKINLIDMQDSYKEANVAHHVRTPLTTPAYYRLSLSSLLPELDKIIWLDGDTLIFDDLRPMFDISMDGLYCRGFLDFQYPMDCFNFRGDHYICSGIMLMNLEKLRQDNMEPKIEEFIKENNDKLIQHDQTVINVLFEKNIGAFPAKYGMFNFVDHADVKHYFDQLISEDRYTEEEVFAAYENPVILHYVNKPWHKNKVYKENLWWEYAAKTDYLSEIKEKYGVA